MASLLILAFVILMAALGYALVRRRKAVEKRDRRWHELANELSGDAGGMPLIDKFREAERNIKATDYSVLHPQPPSAWRGTGARR